MPRQLQALLILILISASAGYAQQSESIRDRHVEARVVSESSHFRPGQPFRVGLLLNHDKHWHTYWKSTSTGYATSIQWNLPDGFQAGPLQWPTPNTYTTGGFTEFVYEGETLLMATLTPPADWTAAFVRIGFKAEWLMCEDVCIPGEAEGWLEIPMATAGEQAPSIWAPLFSAADAALPQPAGPYEVTARRSGNTVTLTLSGGPMPDSLYFFNDQALLSPEPEPHIVSPSSLQSTLTLAIDPVANEMPTRLTGVLRAEPGWPALGGAPGLIVDLPLLAASELDGGSASAINGAQQESPRLGLGMLLLALTGGLVLNLMPCVFPVLGIKIMGFVQQGGQSRSRVAAHGLVFTAGVLISFWILATVLIGLRAGGQQLGWGFQLQEPGFVLALAFLLLAFGLNMSGIFEVGQSAMGVGGSLTARHAFGGSFFSGVLATVVVTPCAAPFLAPALGAALALPPLASLTVFTAIAVGLSTPYLTLSIFPGLLRWLPRPGAWMETFKQGMAFLLYATVAFLIWVMAGQLTEAAGYPPARLLAILLAMVLLSVALWVLGRWGAFHRPPRVRRSGLAASLILATLALYTGFSATSRPQDSPYALQWESWEPGKAAALASEGKTVYVDFTARWCVTCQTNKAAVFSSERVLQRVASPEVVLLKADWTNRDPRISEALARHGRSAVPFNLVFGPAIQEPLVLPEILTPAIVLQALDNAAGR